jgi:RHS repeat-associated protein
MTGNCEFLSDYDPSEYDDPPNEECLGNPCSPATGRKMQTFVDYEAPGLRFVRTWRSEVAPPTAYAGHWTTHFGTSVQWQAVLPWGWTHNFAMKLFFEGSDLIALFRPDGAYVGVEETAAGSGIYIAIDGSGIQARGSYNTDITVYLPDGGKEVYEYVSCSGSPPVTGHRLEQVVDASGRVTQLQFAPTCNVVAQPIAIVGPFGHTLQIQYNTTLSEPRPFIKRLVDAAGQNIDFVYANKTVSPYKDTLLQTVTYQDGSAIQFLYGDNRAINRRLLTGLTDEEDIQYASFAYDDQGRATNTQRAGGYFEWDFVYNTDETTSATDANSVSSTYAYQSSLGRQGVIGDVARSGSERSKTNETSGQYRLLTSTDERGVTTSYDYDLYHLTSMTEADGASDVTPRTTSYTYLNDTSQLVTEEAMPSACYDGTQREKLLETEYVSGTQLVSERTESGWAVNGSSTCDPISRTTAIEYGTTFTLANGLPTLIQGPRSGVADDVGITYYECVTGEECGQIETITNAAGHEWTFDTYDGHGRVTQITLPNGSTQVLDYDLRGRLLSMQESAGGPSRTTTYDYYDNGLLQRVTSPNGAYLEYTYNNARLLTAISDNQGNTIVYGYDLAGNRTSEDISDASQNLKKTVDYAYDAFNHIESMTAPGSLTELLFDAVGNLTDETDPNSNDTGHDYDSLNRLIETLDALSGTAEYGYDVADRLISVEAPNGATTEYAYDDLANLLAATSPDTGTTTYTYDAAGNLLTQTDANSVTVEYEYDALNRLTSISYPNSALDVTLTYDAGTNQKGRLTMRVDGSGTTTFSYDVFGNLTQESKVVDGNTHVTVYTYDDADLVESITYPSGRTVEYTRNVLGQITEVETTYDTTTLTVADSIEYEPFGPLSGLTFGNSLVMSRDYDLQYRLTDQTTGSVQDLSFTLDAAGNIDAIADAVNSGLSQSFTQDELHRIDYESGAYGTKDYTYDGVGNRLTRVHDSGSLVTQTLIYVTDSNRLATHDGNTVTINAVGNATADITENLSFVYDDHNRMVEAYVGGVLEATYVYNDHGQRVKKIEATGDERTFVFHYGLGGELIGETIYDDAGAKIGERDYVWLDTLAVAQSEREFSGGTITSGEFVYIHADQLNTPRLATNGSGTVVWRWDSDAFGVGEADLDPDADTNEVNVGLRFPGQYLDEETGLHYNYFRDYDPVIGRYVESDPIGLEGGINTYAYVGGNPIGRIDPTGEAGQAVVGCIAGSWAGPAGCGVGAAGATIGTLIGVAAVAIYDMCTESDAEREKRCQENLDRDLATCRRGSKRYGKDWFRVCEQQAMLRYSNCLSGRDNGIDAPLPPWGKL